MRLIPSASALPHSRHLLAPRRHLLVQMDSWDVHKFGGTSVGSAECMMRCIAIIRPRLQDQRVAVVVSAMGGKPKVTDLLLDSVYAAAENKSEVSEAKLTQIQVKHTNCVSELLHPEAAKTILQKIDADLKDIRDLLRAVSLMRMAHEQILELVSGYGELWSATIMTEAMLERGLPFVFLNARDVLMVSENELGTNVHWEESTLKLKQWIARVDEESAKLGKPRPHLMITGYIASTLDGIATTLKRDGSDFSASIFGRMLSSTGITIWTDVSGVYSADPRRVPDAQIIPLVSYTEAIELAYFGAKVIHPKTMSPAIDAQIPIYIRTSALIDLWLISDTLRQHLRAGAPRHQDIPSPGQGRDHPGEVRLRVQHRRQHRAPQRGGLGHDRSARHSSPTLRRSQGVERIGHVHRPGLIRAQHLLCD